jgi:thioredoxin-like negative regulator of GroEL
MPHTIIGGTEAGKKFKKANKTQTYVILYHMSSCPHCIMMRPAWQAMLANVGPNCCTAEVEYSHIDDLPESMRAIRGFPTIVAVRDAKTVAEYNGDRGEKSLAEFVKAHAKLIKPHAKSEPKPKNAAVAARKPTRPASAPAGKKAKKMA